MAASSINFKSVGKSTRAIKQISEETQVVTPIGLKSPLSLGSDNTFATNNDLFEQVRHNLKDLILTNHGERLVHYFYGANLIELATERTSLEEYDNEVAARIIQAVQTWMPYVSLNELIPLDEPDDLLGRSRTSTIPVRRYLITYEMPQINSPKQSLEIVIGIA